MRTLFALCFLLFLNACGTKTEKPEMDPDVNLEEVSLSMDADANENGALSIDLVLVYKKELLDALMQMSAADYYASAQQIRRDFPGMVDVWHWELTPGQLVKDYPIRKKDHLVGGVVFADYVSPGDHRIRLGKHETIHARFKKYDFCVLELGCAEDLNKTSIHKSALSKNNPQLDALEGRMNKSADNSDGGDDKMDLSKVMKEAESLMKKFKK